MVTVEKGIPIPDQKRTGRPMKYRFDLMEIGDSMFSEEHRLVTAAFKWAERYGRKVESRAVDGGYRVWRTE